jgi:hypothetical protein
MQCSSGTRSTSLSPLQMLRDNSVYPSRLVCSQPVLILPFRHCVFPLLKHTAHSLTTWLAHSKKQHCDVCKYPYSFTKGSWHLPAPDHSKQRADISAFQSMHLICQNDFPSCSYFASLFNNSSPSCYSASAQFWSRASGWPCYPGSPCGHGGHILLWETLRACPYNPFYYQVTDFPQCVLDS